MGEIVPFALASWCLGEGWLQENEGVKTKPRPGSSWAFDLIGLPRYVSTARIRTTMRWCPPTRMRQHMSAATMGLLMQVSAPDKPTHSPITILHQTLSMTYQ